MTHSKSLIKPVVMGEGNLPSECCLPCAPADSWIEGDENWSTAWLGLCCAESKVILGRVSTEAV